MPGSRPTIRQATAADARRVGETLAAAFRDDPVFAWLIPVTRSRRDRRLTTFFTGMAATYLRHGKPVYLAGNDASAALWSSPDGDWVLPPADIVRQTRPALSAFGRLLPRALRSQLQVESLHPREPRHWYLGYLGTRPDDQGKGIGQAMLEEVLTGADTGQVGAYLESSCERNLTLYQRVGFDVVDEIQLLGSGPTVWRMWREPR
jgi:GNAT superfamily N-acetyltransferase